MSKKNQTFDQKIEQNQWFSVWFNTPFYHLLYNKRNYTEADAFISKLLLLLKPAIGSRVLDLACGSGRHSITLNRFGLDVLGVDLAENSIDEAKRHENHQLHFEVQDMREVRYPGRFDYIFNLFTSFGYFNSLNDDEKVLLACFDQLKPDGILVLDYFNIEKIRPTLPSDEIEIRGAQKFIIHKKLYDNRIIKTIELMSEGEKFHFEESVAAYTLDDLVQMLGRCGFTIKYTFGNYALENDAENCDRVIIIAQKN